MSTAGDHRILDAHHHVGSLHGALGGLHRYGSGGTDQSDAAERASRIAVMDRFGIDQAVIIAGHTYLRPRGLDDTRAMNDRVAEYRAGAPDRFPVAIGVAEPLHGDEGLAEIDRCAEELGFAGISFHARFQGVSLDSPLAHRYVAHVVERGMVPYLHAISDSPENALWKIEGLAAEHPDAPMVVLDAFTNFEQAREVIPIAERRRNLWFDTALALNFKLLRPFVDRFGPERIVFGTDLYAWADEPQGNMLAEILASDLASEAKDRILGANLRTVLGVA